MTIEIRIIDIIYLSIAFGGVILCIALHLYDRHQMVKWFEENIKEENPDNNYDEVNTKYDTSR